MGSRPGEIQLSPALIAPLVILALSLFGASPAAHAQPRLHIPRSGMLGRTPGSAGSFLQARRDLGYSESQTMATESRWKAANWVELNNVPGGRLRCRGYDTP